MLKASKAKLKINCGKRMWCLVACLQPFNVFLITLFLQHLAFYSPLAERMTCDRAKQHTIKSLMLKSLSKQYHPFFKKKNHKDMVNFLKIDIT